MDGEAVRVNAADQYVRQVRKLAVAEIESRLYDIEGRIASHLNGPIQIPRSAMRDYWRELIESCGRFVVNLKIDGDRVFTRGDGEGFDCFLERYDPVDRNVNTAIKVFAADVNAVLELREQRGAIMRDGMDDPRAVAQDQYEEAALSGCLVQAILAVLDLETAA